MLSNYTLKNILYEGTNSYIYQGFRNSDQLPVIIKVIKSDNPSLSTLNRLRTEYEALSRIDSPYVIKTFGLENVATKPILILENYEGKSLGDVQKILNLDIQTALKIAIDVATALGEIHIKNVIHKDIKPQNILVNERLNQIKIIDFGIASLLSREVGEINLEQLEGTLFYISPEQTGRMNRSLDYRTDIYSLGVTLYQLFTHVLPFSGSDPMQIIHQHIAVAPEPPHRINGDIPEPLSAVLMKCLEKNPEDRYHSAFGLRNDLQHCLTMLNETGFIPPFIPGEKDVYDHFQIPQKLYGRVKEVEVVTQSLDSIAQGACEVLMVKGSEGIGKSSIIGEIQKIIPKKNGFFIKGKYDQGNQNIPYLGLIQAFDHLTHQLLAMGEQQIATWRNQILKAVGNQGGVISQIIPLIELIIGEQPPVAFLEAEAAEHRFRYIFSNFIEIFISAQHPLVIFLDDLQWGDAATFEFLKFFFKESQHPYLLLIGAYRDSDVNEEHRLTLFQEFLTKCGIPLKILDVKQIPVSAVAKLIFDTLHTSMEGGGEILANIIHRKTGGNPFFVNQFLKLIYLNRLLNFDSKQQQWKAEIKDIETFQVTQNVVDLMEKRINLLPSSTQILLQIGAAMGSTFELAELAAIENMDASQALEDLKPALEEELIYIRTDSRGAENEKMFVSFQHDRFYQIAYQLISEKQRAEFHYKIGQYFLRQEGKEERILEIVNQLNKGIIPQEEKVSLAQLNLKAGIKSKGSAAYESGTYYFNFGINLLDENAWEEHYQLIFELYENLTECLQLCGEREKSQKILIEAMSRAQHPIDKLKLYRLKVLLLNQMGDYQGAILASREAASLYNLKFKPKSTFLGSVVSYFSGILPILLRGKEWIRKIPPANKEEAPIFFGIMAKLVYAAYHIADERVLLACGKFTNSLTKIYGFTPGSSQGYLSMCVPFLSERVKMYKFAYKIASDGLELSKSFPNTQATADVNFMYYFFADHWVHPHKEQIIPLQEVADKCFELGSVDYGTATYYFLLYKMFICGETLGNLLTLSEKWIKKINKFNVFPEALNTLVFREFVLKMMNISSDPLRDEIYQENKAEIDKLPANHIHNFCEGVLDLIFTYLTGADATTLKNNIKRVLKFKNLFPGIGYWYLFYFYYGLSMAVIYEAEPTWLNWLKFKGCLIKVRRWSKTSPLSFRHEYLLLLAEQARLKRNFKEARTYYQQSIDASAQGGYGYEEALAYQLAAHAIISASGKSNLATSYLQNAYKIYQNLGAVAILKRMSKQLPKVVHAVPIEQAYKFSSGTQSETQTSKISFDTASMNIILEAIQNLSRETDIETLEQSLLRIALLNSGADRVVLILQELGKFFLRAELQNNDHVTLFNFALEEKPDSVCVPIVEAVISTKNTIAINDISDDEKYAYSSYFNARQPKSILCLPLLRQDNVKGVLYLENYSTIGAFTTQRIHILSILCIQAAICLANVQFYLTLEKKVEERTEELSNKNISLEQALKKLKIIQNQIIQQEKFASLGLLTTGISHELKNPLNFVINFSEMSNEIVQEGIDNLNEKIIDEKQFNETLAELDEYLQKIDQHGKRANAIIDGMLGYKAEDEKKSELIGINQVLDQAIGLAYYTFRKREPEFNAKIVKDFSPQDPKAHILPDDLNRVFINIIDNACYALNEKHKQDSNHQPVLGLHTQENSKEVSIIIEDNGIGIPQEYVNRLFEPFFTTKAPGKGTGLGLSIAYDIITKNKGTLEVFTESGKFTRFIIKFPQ